MQRSRRLTPALTVWANWGGDIGGYWRLSEATPSYYGPSRLSIQGSRATWGATASPQWLRSASPRLALFVSSCLLRSLIKPSAFSQLRRAIPPTPAAAALENKYTRRYIQAAFDLIMQAHVATVELWLSR